MTPVGCDAGPMHVSSKHMAEIRKGYAATSVLAEGAQSLSPCSSSASRGPAACMGQGSATAGREKELLGAT